MAYDINDNHINVYKHDSPSTELAEVSPSSIKKLTTVEQVSYLGDELAYDTMLLDANQERTIDYGGVTYDSQLEAFPYGSIVKYTNPSGSLERDYYVDTSERIGVNTYEYNCVSIIGMLDRQIFGGNVYRLIWFESILREIVGTSGTLFDYDCSNVATVVVSGWIPYGTKRDALQQLLFATNIHAFWDDTNKKVIFDYIDHTTAGTVVNANIFDKGKVEYPQLATKVVIIEHDFFWFRSPNENLVTLFDNTQSLVANGELVKFSQAPIAIATLQTTGTLTFTNATTDSAVVTGRGTLKGLPYYHTTFQLERNANVATRKEYEVSVSDAYLVSFINSENVADRIADYYFNRYIVKADIKLNGQKCGWYYSLKDAFKTAQTGFLQKMDKVFSSFVRASCEFLCGVSEEYEANAFSRYRVIYHNTNTYEGNPEPGTSPLTGTWTVPVGITKIRVILIGGGQGGDSGFPGENGSESGEGGKGGAAGASGHGGNIYVVALDVTPGEVFNYSLGEGGAGGAYITRAQYDQQGSNNAGAEGGDTTFYKTGGTVYSSANGAPSDIGFHFTGVNAMEAQPGADMSWGAGADGGNAGQASDNESDTEKRKGKAGGSVSYGNLAYSGGAAGSGTFVSAPTSFKTIIQQAASALTGLYYMAQGSTTKAWYAYSSLTDKQGLWNNANTGQTYCDITGWKCSVGIPGGGGGGAAFTQNGYAGGNGVNASAYPTNFYGDYDTSRVLRDGDSWCWHETNITRGGSGGNGGSAVGYYNKMQYSTDSHYGYLYALGIGGYGGFGGGGGGGAASSVSKQSTVQWFFTEFVENSVAPTVGTGGGGGKGQDGGDGGIIIYY